MEDEVNERVVSVAFSAAQFTATTLARALAQIIAADHARSARRAQTRDANYNKQVARRREQQREDRRKTRWWEDIQAGIYHIAGTTVINTKNGRRQTHIIHTIINERTEQEKASEEISRDTDPRGCLLLCGNVDKWYAGHAREGAFPSLPPFFLFPLRKKNEKKDAKKR